MEIIVEAYVDVTRDNVTLHIEELVVKEIDVEFLGGIPFMSNNVISIRPVKHEIMVGDSHTINYNTYIVPDTKSQYHVRRTQAHVFQAHLPQSGLDYTLM